MNVLIDTNIILDHLLDRKPFNQSAKWIFSQAEGGRFQAFIGGTTVTTVHYLITKELGIKVAHKCIEKLLRIFQIAPITHTVLLSALLLKFPDYEDAVLYEAAIHSGSEIIVTRDIKGFRLAKIPVYSSDEFVASFSAH